MKENCASQLVPIGLLAVLVFALCGLAALAQDITWVRSGRRSGRGQISTFDITRDSGTSMTWRGLCEWNLRGDLSCLHARQRIFWDDRDRSRFVELLAESARRFEVSIFFFVLMGNHVRRWRARRAKISKYCLDLSEAIRASLHPTRQFVGGYKVVPSVMIGGQRATVIYNVEPAID
jgi:hypothetical protein